ncbi:MAG: inosine/xanthosine triphosphatase [Candidatus Moraniibacteriota bacterium]
MQKIVIASKNPVKINAALTGFQKMFPSEQFEIEGISVFSGVSDQPQTDSEAFDGALNRAENANREKPDADFWVGIEGGIEMKNGEMECFAWVVIRSKDNKHGKGRTGTFFLPPEIRELVLAGEELGKADDIVFKRSNSKESNGAIGILTGDVIDRTSYYLAAVVFALIPFKNRELFPHP